MIYVKDKPCNVATEERPKSLLRTGPKPWKTQKARLRFLYRFALVKNGLNVVLH